MRDKRLLHNSPSLESALKKYLKEISPKKKSHEQELSVAKIWLNLPISKRPIGTIRPAELVRIRDEWEKKYQPATIVRRFALLSHLYTVAIKDWQWSYIKENPVEKVRKPSVNNARDRRIYTDIKIPNTAYLEAPESEIEWIVRRTKSKVLPTIVSLAVETAMRRSEIVNVEREHLDFDRSALFVPDSKNGLSRYIPLSPIAKYTLIMYLTRHNKLGRIFSITASAISRSFNRARKAARLDYETLCREKGIRPDDKYFYDLRFHDLRHEAISRLATIYEIHELAKISGHADTRMLLRYYHPTVEDLGSKLINSPYGQQQFNQINNMLLQML